MSGRGVSESHCVTGFLLDGVLRVWVGYRLWVEYILISIQLIIRLSAETARPRPAPGAGVCTASLSLCTGWAWGLGTGLQLCSACWLGCWCCVGRGDCVAWSALGRRSRVSSPDY